MVTIDREELAWAAGFFDGEGSTSIRRDKKRQAPRIVLTISQAGSHGRILLDKFNTAVGNLAYVTGPYYWPKHGYTKEVYRLGATKFESVQAIMAMLWFKLGRDKREQYKRCLVNR